MVTLFSALFIKITLLFVKLRAGSRLSMTIKEIGKNWSFSATCYKESYVQFDRK